MTNVLVFESDSDFAKTLQTGLGTLGCATTVVDDAEQGMKMAESQRPDLILLSIELPRMNGFSVCNKLKRNAALKDVPLIIMSSDSTDEPFEQHKRLRTRAEDYLHKPISVDQLVERIRSFVPLQSPAAEEGDDLVIEDEIEIEEAIELDAEGDVDNDMEALTEAAFGAITSPSKAPPPPPRPASVAPPAPVADLRPPPPTRAGASSASAADSAELDEADIA